MNARSFDDPTICAHTGAPVVRMRTDDDCMICALAMFAGRSYDEVVSAARIEHPRFPDQGPMSHSMLRVLASRWNIALVSSIYMLWDHPAIIGVVSPTIPNCGHAVVWDGEKIIDPHPGIGIDRDYVQSHALEFTQRAADLRRLVQHDSGLAPAMGQVSLEEFW